MGETEVPKFLQLGTHFVKDCVVGVAMHRGYALSSRVEQLISRVVRAGSLRQAGCYPAHNVLRAHGARLTCNLMSPSEQNQGWNAANTELGGQVRLGLGIDLGQPDPGFELVRRLLELRGHHLARPAPWRPEIDQQRQIAALHVARERRRGQLDGLAREQGLLAAATVGMFR